MKITWLGQAGLMLETEGVCIIVDPYLSNSVAAIEPHNERRVPVDERFLSVTPDILVLTHNHLDHTDPETLALIDCEREPDIVEEFCSRSLILDDLGAERAQSNFGQPREIAAEFIMRYHAKCSGHRLFVTTNLTGAELLARYQQRVLTRLTDLMHFVKFTGASKRGNGGAR